MDPEAEEKYWLVATPTTKQNGSPVYYRSPSSGKYHAIIHSVIPPTLHVLCEQWHEDEDTGEYEKYTVVEEVTVTTKELDASVALYNKTLAQKQAAAQQQQRRDAKQQQLHAQQQQRQPETGSSSSEEQAPQQGKRK